MCLEYICSRDLGYKKTEQVLQDKTIIQSIEYLQHITVIDENVLENLQSKIKKLDLTNVKEDPSSAISEWIKDPNVARSMLSQKICDIVNFVFKYNFKTFLGTEIH